MIVVVGSRHDPVAAALVDQWPSAALCSAEDLTRSGWAWSSDPRGPSRWVVDGAVVDDHVVTGVFVRRSAVYPEELVGTHVEDRAYLAAESHAFLVFVLTATGATVVNPTTGGALGDEAMGPERWMPAAADAGLPVAGLRMTSGRLRPRPRETTVVQVVGDQAFGAVALPARRAVTIVGKLGLLWAVVAFDSRHRLVDVTTTPPPGKDATVALGRLLAAPVAL